MHPQPSTYYYAVDNQRVGPLSAGQFEEARNAGAIQDTTLVWNEALPNWVPFSQFLQITAQGYRRCAVSGNLRPVSLMIQFGDDFVSAEHRDAFLARVKEGLPGHAREIVDPAELARRLQVDGYPTDAGSIISYSFSFWKSNFWFSVGICFVGLLISMVAGQIPLAGLLAAILLQPHLMAGIQLGLVRRMRYGDAPFEVLFEPLKTSYGKLVLYALLSTAIMGIPVVIMMIIGFFLFGGLAAFKGQPDLDRFATAMPLVIISMGAVMALVLALSLRIAFAPILIVDKGLAVMDALRLSWKATGMRFFTLCAAFLVLGFCSMLGAIALFIGIILTVPLFFIGYSKAYEDAFGNRNVS